MNENPYESPRSELVRVAPRRRSRTDWLMLAAIALIAVPILFAIELAAQYALEWFGVLPN